MYTLAPKAELDESGGISGVPSEKIYLRALIVGEAQDPIRQPVQRGTDNCQFRMDPQKYFWGLGSHHTECQLVGH